MKIERLEEFDMDLKHLLKKFRTLQEDIEVVERVLSLMPDQRPPFSFRIENLGLKTCMIKVKKIACRSLKGRGVQSGLRLVYAHFPEKKRIVFVELYYKADQESENRDRIFKNFE